MTTEYSCYSYVEQPYSDYPYEADVLRDEPKGPPAPELFRDPRKPMVDLAQLPPSPLSAITNASTKAAYIRGRIASRTDQANLDHTARKTLHDALLKVSDLWDEGLTQPNNCFTAMFVDTSLPPLTLPGVTAPDRYDWNRKTIYHIPLLVATELASLAAEFPRMSQKNDLLGMLWKLVEDNFWSLDLHSLRRKRAGYLTLSEKDLTEFTRKLRASDMDWVTLKETAGKVKPWDLTFVEKLQYMGEWESHVIIAKVGVLYYPLSRWPPEEEKSFWTDSDEAAQYAISKRRS
ncbi:hypothetical protein MMC10_007730 [Thelotrema lepadinum]|nr:hypothetical protein [Thelotrema lepadinum]